MKSQLRIALLSSTAAVALLALQPGAAQAQMYSTGPGFYLSAEGRYMWNAGNGKVPLYQYDYESGDGYDTARTNAKKGWGGKGMIGYRFNNNWDVGVGLQFDQLKGKDSAYYYYDGENASRSDKLKVKLDVFVLDFEAGYTMSMGQNSSVRLFGGLRFADFNQTAKGSSLTDPSSYDWNYFDVKRKTTFRGVGPRIGVNGQFGIGSSGFNVFGGISGALLVGRYTDKHSFVSTWQGIDPSPNYFSYKDKKKTKLVPNVDGEIGLGYTFNAGGGTTVGLQVGYKADAWFGTGSKRSMTAYSTDTVGSNYKDKDADNIFHGPFVRLVATFGSAAPAPMAPPPPPPPTVTAKKSFIVFFDFDKSNITSAAQTTINDAVAAAKAGHSAQVTLTGHTDRSGSEQYNLALSLRRAEAVKANMIKQGIPASSIVVIGKGESQPLVPTADGVREPQNRRVEIVI